MAFGFFNPGERSPGSLTPEDIRRRRDMNEATLAQAVDTSPVQGGWVEALARVMAGGVGGYFAKKDNDAEKAERTRASSAWDKAFGAYFGAQGGTSSPGSSGTPSASSPSAAAAYAPSTSSAGGAPAKFSGSKQEFVDLLMPSAVEASARTGVDPRIIVAQGALESAWGKSAPGNNYFGIKSHGEGGGQTFTTHEVIDGQRVKMQDSFRQFASPADSVAGYADFLLDNPRYRPMMEAQGLDAQIAALGRSGYATDPAYAQKIAGIANSLPAPQGGTQVTSLDPSDGMAMAYAPQPKPQSAVDAVTAMGRGAQAVPPVAQQPVQQPQQMAQAAPSSPPPGMSPNAFALMQMLTDPWLDDGRRAMGTMMLEQEMKRNAPPSLSDQLALKRFEYDQGRDKIEDGRADREFGLKERAANKAPDAPSGVREYEFARTQGFTGTFAEWEQQNRRAGATVVNMGGGDNKQVFDAMAESAAAARAAATGLAGLSEAKRALDAGMISGAGADVQLGLQKIGAALGIVDSAAIQNTETFRAAIAPQVAAVMKATVGSTQISNADRDFAERAAGGSISLDAGSISRLIDIMDRASRAAIAGHADRLEKVYPGSGQFERERALFGVQAPAPLPNPPGGSEWKTLPSGVKVRVKS